MPIRVMHREATGKVLCGTALYQVSLYITRVRYETVPNAVFSFIYVVLAHHNMTNVTLSQDLDPTL